MSLGAPELVIILVIVLVLFGSTRLPKLARSMGEASKEFKKGVDEAHKPATEPLPPVPASDADVNVTMTKAELDALLAEREAKARREAPPSSI